MRVHCDAEALEASVADDLPVPGDYAAVCPLGREERTATAPPPPAAPAGPVRAASPALRAESGEKPRKESAPDGPKPVPAPDPAASNRPRTTARPRSVRPEPAPSRVPTLRQAVAAFLAESSGTADATAMLLGTRLGSCNRLTVLEDAGAADRLTAWCDGHWPDRGSDTARRALDSIRRAVDFWGARGRLTTGPAAGIRRAPRPRGAARRALPSRAPADRPSARRPAASAAPYRGGPAPSGAPGRVPPDAPGPLGRAVSGCRCCAG
ncbi:hypothetical protein [Streptomyces sp. DH37]|uniref:hypothetical protein n=1 Tax=Streptomyces sp. DH37 TaxID=3040122 RepID=UPI002442E429|nr:hypothetical protein [Streptomyces sp. DH37]MDG9702023.1 hypothetical protein [Streptomyces sp. DH37]